MKIFFAVLLISSSALADSKTACIEKIAPAVGFDVLKAAAVCKGRVGGDCIDKVAPSVGFNVLQAAKVCKGGVTAACIEKVAPAVGFNVVEAAKHCSDN